MEISETTASVKTEGNSHWFSGHFPNNPILPGIAQLKMVVDLITKSGACKECLSGLSRVKFRKIVRPGDQLVIRVTPGTTDNHSLFRITSGDEEVCSGKMHFTQKPIITNS